MFRIGRGAQLCGAVGLVFVIAACTDDSPGPEDAGPAESGRSGLAGTQGDGGTRMTDGSAAGDGGTVGIDRTPGSDAAGDGGSDREPAAAGGTTNTGAGGTGAADSSVPASARALASGCSVAAPNAWLTPNEESLIAACNDSGLATLPLDGSEEAALAMDPQRAAHSVLLVDDGILFVDQGHLMRARFGEGVAETLAIDVTGPLALTPDRKLAVFAGPTESGGVNGLFVVDLETGDIRRVHEQSFALTEFLITPDGTRALLMGKPVELWSVDLIGDDTAQLGAYANDSTLADSVAFSPDGTKVAFLGEKPGSGYEFVITSFDGRERVSGGTFETGGSGDITLEFVPDGSRAVLAWLARQQLLEPGAYRLDSVPVGGGDSEELARADRLRFFGVVGGQLKAVLYAAQVGGTSPGMFLVSAEGGTPSELSTLSACATAPNVVYKVGLSPDRAHAVYTDAFGDLVIADLDERSVRKLVPGATAIANTCQVEPPLWSPDGTLIAYQRLAPSADPESFVITPSGEIAATIGPPPWVFAPDSGGIVSGGRVLRFGEPTRLLTDKTIPLLRRQLDGARSLEFVPTTFPWLDSYRFIMAGTSSGSDGLFVVDLSD